MLSPGDRAIIKAEIERYRKRKENARMGAFGERLMFGLKSRRGS
jgi:hypothetical protein